MGDPPAGRLPSAINRGSPRAGSIDRVLASAGGYFFATL